MKLNYTDFEYCFKIYLNIEEKNIDEKKNCKRIFSKLFTDFPNLLEVFDVFDNIEEMNDFKNLIEEHIKEEHMTKEELIEFYDLTEFKTFVLYVLTLIDLNKEVQNLDENSNESDSDKTINYDNDSDFNNSDLDLKNDNSSESDLDSEDSDFYLEDYDSNIDMNEDNNELSESFEEEEFKWKVNQIEGIENAVACDFESGIHSQATGTGKSLMALNIIKRYHDKYPDDSIMWLCERKDIPEKLFFNRNKKGHYVYHKENFNFWKKNNIINMDDFHVINLVSIKPNNWTSYINNYNNEKPKFIIVNRAFLTTNSNDSRFKFKYQELIHNNAPKLVVHDECHSTPAPRTYELILHMKEKWNAKIQGLSATPFREGKTTQKITIELNKDNCKKWETGKNINRLINVYPKPDNENQLHLLSQCNLKRAIEEGFILEPVFHWFYVDKFGKKGISHFSNNEFESMMIALNNMIEKCTYKKVLIWCKYVKIAENMYDSFNKTKVNYTNLKDLNSYIYHSQVENEYDEDYNEFYKQNNTGIMFCANMFREGSDIPNLCGALFMDKVKERGEIPFIQSVGRVLRTDPKGKKTNGHILDCCIKPKENMNESDKDKENTKKIHSLLNKLIKYYLRLYELSLDDNIDSGENYELSKIKVSKYEEILKNFEPDPDSQMIHLKLNNDKKLSIDIKGLELHSIDWKNLTNSFEKVWEKHFNFNDIDDFNKLKFFVKKNNIHTIEEYNQYCINNPEKNFPIEPKIKYGRFWKNWYDFIGIDITIYPLTKTQWTNKCTDLKLFDLNIYLKECLKHNLPLYPEELYLDFTSFTNEFRHSILPYQNKFK